MKESGMEKLIELLNEYEEQKEKETGLRAYEWESCCDGYLIQATNIVTKGKKTPLALIESRSLLKSKDYGFIKRLIDHNKIDFDKVMKLGIPCFVRYDKGEIISVHDVDFDRQLIMLISISDAPIEDLISYLK